MSVNNIQFTKIEIKILKYIFKHFKDRYNARQLAKSLSLNHSHVNKLCGSLLKKKLLEREEIGNSIYYRFNYNCSLALKFIEYILSLEAQEFPKWLKVLSHNLKKFKEHIKLGCVFGSSIKSNRFNDIDVLLVYNPSKQKIIKKIKDSIRNAELIEKPIRYVEITERDIKKNKGEEVFYSILSENLIFHNPGKYVGVIKCLK